MPYDSLVRRSITRPLKSDVDELGLLGVATVHEAYRQLGLMSRIYPVVPGVRTAGAAVTCLGYAGENLMIHAALDVIEPGDIVVASFTGPSMHGAVGDLIATSAHALGANGIVLDAAARDVNDLRQIGLGVWSRGISALGTVKTKAGWVNTPVSCGGVVVFPGDAIVADDDGVVVVERADVGRVLEAAKAREQREVGIRERAAGGGKGIDSGNRRQLLIDAGAYAGADS